MLVAPVRRALVRPVFVVVRCASRCKDTGRRQCGFQRPPVDDWLRVIASPGALVRSASQETSNLMVRLLFLWTHGVPRNSDARVCVCDQDGALPAAPNVRCVLRELARLPEAEVKAKWSKCEDRHIFVYLTGCDVREACACASTVACFALPLPMFVCVLSCTELDAHLMHVSTNLIGCMLRATCLEFECVQLSALTIFQDQHRHPRLGVG